MDRRVALVCAWCGPVFLVLFVVGFWFVAGFVPPPKPSDSAAQIAAFYRDNTDRIRVGMLLSMVATALLAPFIVLITSQMKRRNPRLALLADIQLLGGFALLLLVMLPIALIALAAFRPERPAETTQLLNDAALFILFWVFSTPVVEYLAMAAYSLMDRSDRPLIPRWAGWFDVATAVIFVTGAPVLFVKDGPFAWNGLLAFWAVLFIFAGWVLVSFVCVLREALTPEM